ncbi:hypothetical protein V5O48_007080 [Marasmius crinis-equi]|uniref:Uncharacterized protein n=1 Tax=Marasmius crinis-equi TaxID=585013 RepID=A0ABR3FHP3_9AGAR
MTRPEPTIRECFDSSILFPFNSKPKHVSLEQSGQLSQDIRLYLCDRLNEIHHKLEYDRVQFPDPWPPEGAIEQLTGMSGGQFMYASSVLDFVNDESEDPSRRLAVVLHLAPARRRDDESPFRAMDQLYQPILSATPDRRLVLTILGFILHNPLCSSIENIEELLDLPKGQVGIALRGMHSVLHIRESAVRFFYPSFVDFLNDKSRSGDCFLDSTHFQSFTVSRHPEEICNSNSKSESSALASVVWHQWSRFCKKVRDPTQELISALEKLDLDAIYSVLVYGAETSDQGGWYKEWQGVIGRVCETAEWLEERQPESLHLISKFRASMEGFHISFGKSSVLDDALKLLYARSLYGTEQSLVSESHREDDGTKNDPGPLEDVIKAIQTHRREEHAQSDSDVLVYDSRRECTSDTHPLTPSLSPAECSPGIFYVRTWHPPAMLISLLIDLITSTNDHTSAAFHTLFIRETTLDLAGPLLVLLPLFSGALPDIISYAAKCSLEPGVFSNFLLWLKTFPQDSEPVDNSRSEIMAIVRSIKEWILSTEGGDDPDGRNQPRYGNVRLLLSELEEDAKIEKARKKASR